MSMSRIPVRLVGRDLEVLVTCTSELVEIMAAHHTVSQSAGGGTTDWVARIIAIVGLGVAAANFAAGRREAVWRRRNSQATLIREPVSTIAELMAAVGQSPAALLNLWSTSCSAALAQLHDGVPMQSDRKLRRKLSTLYTATMDGRGTAAPSQEEASSGAARLRTQSELRSLQTAQQAADAIKARIDVIVRKSGGYL